MDWQLVASYFTVKFTDIFYSAHGLLGIMGMILRVLPSVRKVLVASLVNLTLFCDA